MHRDCSNHPPDDGRALGGREAGDTLIFVWDASGDEAETESHP
jgi:hypothetical protein